MKKIGFLFALMWLTIGTWAQQLTEQEAMDRALQYMNSKAVKARSKAGADGAKLTVAKVGAEKVYAFNREGGGFVIASADERTLPVLGYSDSGSIDWERMPENMRAWLLQYDEAIASLGDRTDFKDGNLLDGGGKSLARSRSARPAVEPLIKTRWAQVTPYNDMCPLYAGYNPEWQGQRCVAGCYAVALAQILNYWQWPKALPDGLPAYEAVDKMYDKNLTWHVDALPPVTFDWENMLDEYVSFNYSTWTYDFLGTEAQQQAVATLLRYCGQAIEAIYSPVQTSAFDAKCRDALVNHFGYAAATYLPARTLFGIDEWEEMVYTELASGRPIIYGGISPISGGHAFVCDGYDGDGLFHINWGWQGDDDGYYSLAVLNPWPSKNPLKGSEHLGFTKYQCMIIGLDPMLKELKNPLIETPELWQYQSMNVLSKNTVKFYFLFNNDAAGTATADYALGTIEADGTLTPRFIGDPNDSIIGAENQMTVEIDSTAFQPGETLRLHPMLRFRHTPEAEWQLIPPDTIYVDAGRRDDGRFFIANKLYDLEYARSAITAGLGRVGGSSDLTVTIRNNEQTDYVGDIWLTPRYYGQIDEADITADTPYTEGDYLENGAYLRAGQEGEVTFLFNPKEGGLVRFNLSTDYVGYFGSFTMRFDTIYSYDPYLVNNSYLTHEGNHYVYHVELCDRPGVTVPDGVPSDSIYLDCRISSRDRVYVNRIRFEEEIRDYLRALPDSAGSGNYKFTTEVSLDVEKDGEYFVWSYLIEWLGAGDNEYIDGVESWEDFTVTLDQTAIREIGDTKPTVDDSIYDLQGRRVDTDKSARPKKGLYIRRGKKFIK